MAGIIDPQQLLGQLAAVASGAGMGGGSSGGPVVGAPAPGGPGGGFLPLPLQNILKQILVSDVKSRFSTGTSPAGVKWRPLAHPRPNGGDVPLRDTGVLMASFTGGSDGRSAWVGTTHPGASLHNFGGVVRGKGKMLAIPLTKEAKRSGGPRRWKGGELQFRLTRKPRVFLLLGAPGGGGGGGGTKPKAPKKPRAKRGKKPKGLAGKAAAVVAGLRKRIAVVRKAAGKTMKRVKGKKRTRRGKKNAGLLAKLLATLHAVTGRQAEKGGKKGGAKGTATSQAGQSLVAQFLLVDQVTIPQREFMGVSEKAWGQITDAVGEAVVRGWMTGPVGGMGLSVGSGG